MVYELQCIFEQLRRRGSDLKIPQCGIVLPSVVSGYTRRSDWLLNSGNPLERIRNRLRVLQADDQRWGIATTEEGDNENVPWMGTEVTAAKTDRIFGAEKMAAVMIWHLFTRRGYRLRRQPRHW